MSLASTHACSLFVKLSTILLIESIGCSEDGYCETDIRTRSAVGLKDFRDKKGLLSAKFDQGLLKNMFKGEMIDNRNEKIEHTW